MKDQKIRVINMEGNVYNFKNEIRTQIEESIAPKREIIDKIY